MSLILTYQHKTESMKTIDSLIEYLEQTNDNDWIVDRVRTTDGKGCVMSHIFDWGGGDNGGSDTWDWFEEVFATTYMIYPVNDGQHPNYQQSTPKERCIAYIRNLRDGIEKTTQALMDEDRLSVTK